MEILVQNSIRLNQHSRSDKIFPSKLAKNFYTSFEGLRQVRQSCLEISRAKIYADFRFAKKK